GIFALQSTQMTILEHLTSLCCGQLPQLLLPFLYSLMIPRAPCVRILQICKAVLEPERSRTKNKRAREMSDNRFVDAVLDTIRSLNFKAIDVKELKMGDHIFCLSKPGFYSHHGQFSFGMHGV
ncbi:hypothetical protein OIU85_000180, partial [Salix viminalis]